MKAKLYIKSKSFWFALATICTGIGNIAGTGELSWEKIALVVVGGVMLFLRAITSEPITFQ